jgi:hypothetical protein
MKAQLKFAPTALVPTNKELDSSIPQDLSPAADEAALLITCLRGLPFDVPSDTDWQTLRRLADENGVLLLVYRQLLASSADMPGHFRDAAFESRVAAESLAAALEVLLEDFAGQGIEVMPIKGPALALALYNDSALRQSNDLDLLVRRDDFQASEALLFRSGFVALGPASEHDRVFLREGLLVELHFEYPYPRFFRFDIDGIWSRSQPAYFRGKPSRTMSKNDLVLYLCAHGVKHGFSRLIWILDLARALEGWEPADYRELMRQAQRQGLQPWLLLGCQVVCTMFPQQLPTALEEVIAASPAALERARMVAARLFSECPEVGVNDCHRFYLQAEPNPFKRWRYRLRYIAPTHTDNLWARSHHILPQLMVILRPFLLLRKYGPKRMWRILFPSKV